MLQKHILLYKDTHMCVRTTVWKNNNLAWISDRTLDLKEQDRIWLGQSQTRTLDPVLVI